MNLVTDASLTRNDLWWLIIDNFQEFLWKRVFSAKKIFQIDFFQAGIDTAYGEEYCINDEIDIPRVCAVKIAFSDK